MDALNSDYASRSIRARTHTTGASYGQPYGFDAATSEAFALGVAAGTRALAGMEPAIVQTPTQCASTNMGMAKRYEPIMSPFQTVSVSNSSNQRPRSRTDGSESSGFQLSPSKALRLVTNGNHQAYEPLDPGFLMPMNTSMRSNVAVSSPSPN